MFRSPLFSLLMLGALAWGACNPVQVGPPPQSQLPNPATVHCEEQGGTVEIVTAPDGSQRGECLFPDGSRCDEWAYFRGECIPQEPVTGPTATPEPSIPPPMDPTAYEGWWTYTHPILGFTVSLPADWVVEEVTTDDPLLAGHRLMLRPESQGAPESIRMTFRRVGEETLLWPTGVGQGEFVAQGTLEIAGRPARRMLLVCPTDEVTAIWYQSTQDAPHLTLDGLEFAFIFSASGHHCTAGHSLGGKIQIVGEMILTSLKAP